MVRDKQHLQAVWFLVEMNIAFRPCSCGAQSELCDITKTTAYQADLPMLEPNERATPLQSSCYLFRPNSSSQFLSQFQLVLPTVLVLDSLHKHPQARSIGR
jgi:hypothetical protein